MMMFPTKFKNSFITLLGLAAFALFAAAPVYSQEKVFVSNSTSEPVPTVAHGTTKVTGTIVVGNTAAAPALVRAVNAASATHLGRKASEIVNLSGLLNATGEIFFMRTLANGTADPSFTIPAGKVPIIKDVSWQIHSRNPGTVARLLLRNENLANAIFIRDVHNSVLTLSSAGVNVVNERLGAGIVVSSAAKITAHVTAPSGALSGLFLIGYLAP